MKQVVNTDAEYYRPPEKIVLKIVTNLNHATVVTVVTVVTVMTVVIVVKKKTFFFKKTFSQKKFSPNKIYKKYKKNHNKKL